MKNYDNLKEGTAIYYTGDMANLPAEGKIIKVKTDKFYPVSYDIELNNGQEKRISKSVLPNNFEGIGKRFYTMAEYQEERQRKIEAFKKLADNLNS